MKNLFEIQAEEDRKVFDALDLVGSGHVAEADGSEWPNLVCRKCGKAYDASKFDEDDICPDSIVERIMEE